MALIMIDPATIWFKVVELPLIRQLKTITNGKESSIVEEIFDKTSERIAWLVNKTWLSRYPRCCYIIYDNGSEFKLNFEPTMVKNPQANAILERLHQVLAQIFCTAELNMAETVTPDDVDVFLDNTAWAICSTYHTVLKASPGATIFRHNMLFDILFIANWNKIGDYRQCQTDLNTARKNSKQIDYDYKVGNKILLTDEGILRKAESPYSNKPWMDYHNNPYKWYYQDSMRNKIGKT
jgi:hypothetical protein